MNRSVLAAVAMLSLALSIAEAEEAGARQTVPWQHPAFSLADYWQKSFVAPDGGLLYDYPGKSDGFRIKVSASLTQVAEMVRQELLAPGVPIVHTLKRAGAIEIEEEAFAAPWGELATRPTVESPGELATRPTAPIERLDAKKVEVGWAAPTADCDPAFQNIAVGFKEPVRYRYRAEAGKTYTVVFGLCEGWHPKPGQRILNLQIEGKTRQKVDLVAEKGRNVPALYPFEARDENGDGWLDIAVAAAEGSPDDNTILNVLWIFVGTDIPPLGELLAGRSSRPALVHLDCGGGSAPDAGPPRHDVLLVSLHNTGAAEAKATPTLTIQSETPAVPDPGWLQAQVGPGMRIDCAQKFESVEAEAGKIVLRFAETVLPAGGRQVLAFSVARGHGASVLFKSVAEAEELRTKAGQYWKAFAAAAQSANYARVYEPPVKPFFTPLPPGAVEPAGWLRDWALAARDGITGHLDEWHPTFGEAWKGVPVKAPGAEADGAGWPIEQCSYWLDGLVRLGYVLHDDTLIQKAQARLNLVVDGVNRGAPSFIYWKKGKPAGFNSWAHSQMGRALVAWYEATGDKRILDALVRAYSEYPVPMGHLNFGDVSGLCNLDAMLETFSFSGDRRVLDRALAAIASPAPQNSIREWLDGRLSEGHAVITYENIRLPALLYPWTGEARYLQASLKAFAWLAERHMLPYGLASGEEYLSGIGAFRKTETCNVVAGIWSLLWLYRIQGERGYGDEIERAFFNAGAAPVARDFKTMCYYQSPNRLGADALPCQQPHSPGKEGTRFNRLGCPHVLCCVGAVNRIVPNYIIHMWMATYDQGLAATLYGPCTVTALAGPGVPVKLVCRTAYPFEETIRVAVEPERKAVFPLYFRIPAWCAKPRLAVNGAAAGETPALPGFARIVREWASGDTVELQFPMQPQVIRGYETEFPTSVKGYFSFEPSAVFQQRRLPYESVVLGPLLFALPVADQDPNTPVPGARWQFALDNDAGRNGADVTVERGPMPPKWDWPLDAPVSLKVQAQAFDWNPTDAQALPNAPVEGTKAETIRLVPYGCTKFRISMFPVTARAWRKP
ncbi:MAG: beta-L-arabinofuranosidase domain-containing protein [Planctomycetota bacterium]